MERSLRSSVLVWHVVERGLRSSICPCRTLERRLRSSMCARSALEHRPLPARGVPELRPQRRVTRQACAIFGVVEDRAITLSLLVVVLHQQLCVISLPNVARLLQAVPALLEPANQILA